MSTSIRGLVVVAVAASVALVMPGQETGSEIRGTIIDGLKRPISDVEVSLRQRNDAGFKRFASTGSAGDFHFTGVPRGHYELVAMASGFYSVRIRDLHLSAENPRPTLRIELEFGMSCPLTDRLSHYFRLLDPADRASKAAAVGGTALDESGAPISGASVALYVPAIGRVATTSTNDEGIFSFERLAVRSDYWIQVVHDGYFAGEFAKLEVEPGYQTVYDNLELQSCEPGHCEPHLKRIRVLPSCE